MDRPAAFSLLTLQAIAQPSIGFNRYPNKRSSWRVFGVVGSWVRGKWIQPRTKKRRSGRLPPYSGITGASDPEISEPWYQELSQMLQASGKNPEESKKLAQQIISARRDTRLIQNIVSEAGMDPDSYKKVMFQIITKQVLLNLVQLYPNFIEGLTDHLNFAADRLPLKLQQSPFVAIAKKTLEELRPQVNSNALVFLQVDSALELIRILRQLEKSLFDFPKNSRVIPPEVISLRTQVYQARTFLENALRPKRFFRSAVDEDLRSLGLLSIVVAITVVFRLSTSTEWIWHTFVAFAFSLITAAALRLLWFWGLKPAYEMARGDVDRDLLPAFKAILSYFIFLWMGTFFFQGALDYLNTYWQPDYANVLRLVTTIAVPFLVPTSGPRLRARHPTLAAITPIVSALVAWAALWIPLIFSPKEDPSAMHPSAPYSLSAFRRAG